MIKTKIILPVLTVIFAIMKTFTAILILIIISFPLIEAQEIQKSQICLNNYFPPPESSGGWRKNTDPAFINSLGIDPQKLKEFGEWNVKNNWDGRSLMPKSCIVIKNGWIIGEWYADKDGRENSVEEGKNKKARLASNGKSISMALFGITVKESGNGIIPDDLSLKSKVYDKRWLPEGFPLSNSRKDQIYFDQIFRHTSGLMPESAGEERGGEKNTIAFIVGKHPEHSESANLYFNPGCPDEYFPKSTYSSVGFSHFTLIFKNLYGIPAYQVLEKKLFNPVGIKDVGYYPYLQQDYSEWLNENIRWVTHGGLFLTPRDYARFAYFLMHDGKWGNKQLTKKGWMEHFRTTAEYPNICGNVEGTWTSGKTKQVGNKGYFPEYPDDMFRIAGSGLNMAYIIPSLDLILIRTSQIYPNSIWDTREKEFLHSIFSAIKDNKTNITVEKAESLHNALPGQVIADPDNPSWLVYNKDENKDGLFDPFFLCGAGDPEGFLYRGKRKADGTRDGDQMKLIKKLKENGGNSIYLMAVRTHGGDGWKSKRDNSDIYPDDKHNPWIDQEPKNGLDKKILDQWEVWFKEMDKNGLIIYFFIYDDAINVSDQFGWSIKPNGELDPDEKKFIQTLINRFKHHKHLIWCIMEEAQEIGENWQLHTSKIAEAISEVDDYNHVIASHQLGGNIFYHANDPNIGQFAIQTNSDEVSTVEDLHQWMLKAWENSNGQYNLNMSEDYVHGNISCPNQDREEIRKRNWAAAMAGAYVMVLGMEIDNTPEKWLHDCRILQTFFESTNFNQMHPNDSLAFSETNYVLAAEDYDYILYSSDSKNNLGLKHLTKGTYSFTWLDCVNGTKKHTQNTDIQEGNFTWEKPPDFGKEVALYIRREDKRPEVLTVMPADKQDSVKEKVMNVAPTATNSSIQVNMNTKTYIQLKYDDPDGGPGPYAIEIISQPKHGTLSGAGNDNYYMPDKDYVGKDQFSWKVNDGKDDSVVARIILTIK